MQLYITETKTCKWHMEKQNRVMMIHLLAVVEEVFRPIKLKVLVQH